MEAPAKELKDSTSQVKKKNNKKFITFSVVIFQIQLNKSFYIECGSKLNLRNR